MREDTGGYPDLANLGHPSWKEPHRPSTPASFQKKAHIKNILQPFVQTQNPNTHNMNTSGATMVKAGVRTLGLCLISLPFSC